MDKTSATLLISMKDPNDQSWHRFFEVYSSAIIGYACKRGLRRHEAEDVLQETMLVMMRRIPEFEYDPNRGRFRGYLFQTVRNIMSKHFRKRSRRSELHLNTSQAARIVDPTSKVLKTAEEDWQQSLMRAAMKIVEERCDSTGSIAYNVFHAVVINEESVTEVAERFDTNENNVYQIKYRVVSRLKEVVKGLGGEDLDGIDGLAPLTI